MRMLLIISPTSAFKVCKAKESTILIGGKEKKNPCVKINAEIRVMQLQGKEYPRLPVMNHKLSKGHERDTPETGQ